MIQQSTSPILLNRDALYFVSGERRMKVPLKRITHITAGEDQLFIYTLGRRYPTTYEISDVMNYLPPAQFFRVHPLHIVALEHVQGIDGKEIMIAGERLFTTHYYRIPLVEALERRRPRVMEVKTIRNRRDTLV